MVGENHGKNINRLVRDNIVDKANECVNIFTGSLHHDLYDDSEIVEQVTRALKRGVRFSIICCPIIDARSGTVLDILLQHRDQVSLAMIRPQNEHLVRSGFRWTVRHFAVADSTHVCVEDLHDLYHEPKHHNAWTEVHDMPAIARGWLNLFDKLRLVAVPLVSTRVADLHEEIVANGGTVAEISKVDKKGKKLEVTYLKGRPIKAVSARPRDGVGASHLIA